jgi:Arc/MetJ family transcription regulator
VDVAMNIEIDEKLLKQVMKLGGYKTKSEAVNAALAEYVRYHKKIKGAR